MLDLKELERKLDEALASETSESLNEWLSSKQLRDMCYLLGEGRVEDLQNSQLEFTITTQQTTIVVDSTSSPKNSSRFSLAA